MGPAIIIPARMKSTRFPGKPLVEICGRALVLRVADIAASVVGKERVFVATDASKIEDLVSGSGYQTIITSPDNLTGTDRVAEAALQVEADLIVNIQGDEPMIDITDIQRVMDAKVKWPNAVINAYCQLAAIQDPRDLNIPKVVFNESNSLLYMSRATVPGSKLGSANQYFRQVCIYAFNRDELYSYKNFGRKSILEELEDIEILRFLELGQQVKMVEVSGGSLAVDVPEDVVRVEDALRSRKQ